MTPPRESSQVWTLSYLLASSQNTGHAVHSLSEDELVEFLSLPARQSVMRGGNGFSIRMTQHALFIYKGVLNILERKKLR